MCVRHTKRFVRCNLVVFSTERKVEETCILFLKQTSEWNTLGGTLDVTDASNILVVFSCTDSPFDLCAICLCEMLTFRWFRALKLCNEDTFNIYVVADNQIRNLSDFYAKEKWCSNLIPKFQRDSR